MQPSDIDVKKLEEEQIRLSKRLKLKDKIPIDSIRLVAGVDVTFTDIWKNPTTGIASVVVLDFKTLNVVDVVYAKKVIDFPYIPTFLAYRELPVILEAYRNLNVKPDVFLIDGQGIIHPRKMGIASHFGVITDEVSIGVAKSKLVGEYQEPENRKFSAKPIYVNRELRGYVLRTRKNSKPIFVSPGNNISVESSVKVVVKCLKNDFRLPEPTRLAHNYLQAYRRKILSES